MVWRLQCQMVADVAATFGKHAKLSKEAMIFCLFRHGAAYLVQDLIVRVGERILVRRVGLKFLQQILEKIGIKITQRLIVLIVSWYFVFKPKSA